MKRSWNNPLGNQAPTQYQPPEDWSSHPYASAYQTLSAPHNPSPLHNSVFDPYAAGSSEKRPRTAGGVDVGSSDGEEGEDGEDDDEDEEEESEKKEGGAGGKRKTKDGKPKAKLTRGSKACIACRKIKMRCIPDASTGPGGPCKRCKSGGHECIFEESNRGKRSTRKNEALAARMAKMEAALKGIGAALSTIDQPSLNSFSTALHGNVSEPDTINLITSYTAPAAVPTLAVAMNRSFIHADTFVQGYGGDALGGMNMMSHPPLSPRLHSLPDNVLSPLGLLAEASLQNTPGKGQGKFGRQGHLGMDGRQGMGRNGSSHLRDSSVNRVLTSDVRGGEVKLEETEGNQGAGPQFDAQGKEIARGSARMDSGLASQNYFKPVGVGVHVGPPGNRLPELLTIVSREEISDLFTLFYDNMAVHVPLIYREFHTPDLVIQRSQFLCTVICAIAARHYTKKPELHTSLSAYAKRLAFEVPSRGYKSVEVVQAYLLLSLWTLGPEKTFEQDRTWMMLGMAIRMATDLNLHRKSVPCGVDTEEGRARDLEIINRERSWLHCFILDRSISAQMGKPYTIREDFIIRKACEGQWHNQKFSLSSDRAMAGYVCLQVVMSRAIDSIYSSTSTINGLRTDADYMMIVRSAHEELRRWLTDWNTPRNDTDLSHHFEWDSRAQFYFAYHSLVLYSFGLENALERSRMDISFFLANVYEAATRVCTVVKETFVPTGYLRYVPDTNFVMCSYALLSLLKLLKPELRTYHDSEEAIFKLVSEMADHLEDCATDPSHQPAIYAAFIREIVRKTREARNPAASARPSRQGSPASNSTGPMNGTIDPALTKGGTVPGGMGGMSMMPPLINTAANIIQNNGMNRPDEGVYDPALMDESANWPGGDMAAGQGQFTYIPQGGDMMILPSAAGPSESVQNSPTANYMSHFPNINMPTPSSSAYPMSGPGAPQPSSTNTSGWAEYLPTFMSSDGFDGWDGSMLLPGFGRNQITLSGGLLHSQFGSGIITPAQHTPSQSRAGSRQASRAASPAT